MTTNIDRAAEVMREAHDKPHWSPMHRCDNMAQALADAGLLMPDLRRPMEVINSDWAKFNEHIEVRDGDVRVYFAGDFGEYPEPLTPAEAREHALELLAAANYAEQEQSNE